MLVGISCLILNRGRKRAPNLRRCGSFHLQVWCTLSSAGHGFFASAIVAEAVHGCCISPRADQAKVSAAVSPRRRRRPGPCIGISSFCQKLPDRADKEFGDFPWAIVRQVITPVAYSVATPPLPGDQNRPASTKTAREWEIRYPRLIQVSNCSVSNSGELSWEPNQGISRYD